MLIFYDNLFGIFFRINWRLATCSYVIGYSEITKSLLLCVFSVFLRLSFSYLKKYVEFFTKTISFVLFIFRSIGVYLCFVGLVDIRKVLTACLIVLVVFLIYFSLFQVCST